MNHSNQESGDDSSTKPFPTGSTTPFPYEEPYPQQIDLMDTLLQSLQRRRRRRRRNSTENDDSPTSTNCCPVYMLESPTGTGKSLSLACAAMAWLRHAEEEDLMQDEDDDGETNNDDDHQTEIQNKKASSSSSWLDDWVPQEQREARALRAKVREQARTARQALRSELKSLRATTSSSASEPSSNRRREHTARAAVLAAKTMGTAATNNKKKKRQRVVVTPTAAAAPEMEFCLDEYQSDENKKEPLESSDDDDWDDGDRGKKQFAKTSNSNQKIAAKDLLDGAALDGSRAAGGRNINNGSTKFATACTSSKNTPPAPALPPTVASVVPGAGVRKIVYAARTHSQLSQFVGELRRTAWGGSVRVAHLGGRRALCGHRPFEKLSEGTLNEACLDLQKGSLCTASNGTTTTATTTTTTTITNAANNDAAAVKGKKRGARRDTTTGCPLLVSRDSAVPTLALHLLAQPTDIEEAAALGRATHTCAYYASRESVAAAEVVVLPYSMLLSQQTRQAVGLSLRQSLVMVDEAHNLPEALRSLHSTRLSLPVLQAALDQLKNYIRKYSDRLAGRNLFYLGQIRRLLLGLQKHLTAKPEKRQEGMMTAAELLIGRKLDNINLFRLLRYLERSRLPQKLLGFTNYTKNNDTNNNGQAEDAAGGDTDGLSKHVSAMSVVQSFLEKLTFSGKEGKIVTDWPAVDVLEDSRSSRSTKHPTLRYVLIHPPACFENVLEEAYALALVGGTLRPFVHVAAELLGDKGNVIREAAEADAATATLPVSQISNSFVTPSFTAFTCDHVVSSSNVLLQCLASGPTGQSLDFRFQSRSSNAVIDELGQTLVKLCATTPCGVVVFLPSYSYEAKLVGRWKKTGTWEDLRRIKKLHREPKTSQQVEAALQSYARDAAHGALLFSVIGGKLSEGINFSNDMARCVVLVGLPYPDITDPELKEKMASLDNNNNNSSTDKTITGQGYYQNLCMRAVNQSVGRAIRHANDYAAVVLMDRRYTSDHRIWSGLPKWLKRGGSRCRQDLPLEQRLAELKQFFESKT